MASSPSTEAAIMYGDLDSADAESVEFPVLLLVKLLLVVLFGPPGPGPRPGPNAAAAVELVLRE